MRCSISGTPCCRSGLLATRALALWLLAAGCGRSAPAVAPGASPAPAPAALTPADHDRRGDELLFEGRFDEALAEFDAAIAADRGLAAHHWRRGIACYYAGRYADGVAQFVLHRTVNPADVENAAWHFLCLARLESPTAARASLLPVGRDARPPMGTIYELFAGRAGADEVLAAGQAAAARSADALFFAHLYLGLHAEAEGRGEVARRHLREAATTHARPHYMGQVARLHHRRLEEAARGSGGD